MNNDERLQLQRMISENNVSDQTDLIRELKHSHLLRKDVNKLIELKAEYIEDLEKLKFEAMCECSFLHTYYYDIYNRILKDELDLSILYTFLDTLKKIEDGELDQHTASYEVGKLLKKIYVDSALRKAEKLEKENQVQKEILNDGMDIKWNTWRKVNKK